MRLKGLVRAKLDEWKIRYVDLEGVLPDGMVRDQKHVEPVVRFFQATGDRRPVHPALQFRHRRRRGHDRQAVRRAHAAVGAARRRAACPTAAACAIRSAARWPPAACSTRCGFRFSYINNCRVEDEEFRRGVERFVRAARVVKRLRSMKIGQVGQRIDFFWSTITNEADLLQRFGIQVMPIDLADLCRTDSAAHRGQPRRLPGGIGRVQEVDLLQPLPERGRYSAQLLVARRAAGDRPGKRSRRLLLPDVQFDSQRIRLLPELRLLPGRRRGLSGRPRIGPVRSGQFGADRGGQPRRRAVVPARADHSASRRTTTPCCCGTAMRR